jgi:hypothetical protein
LRPVDEQRHRVFALELADLDQLEVPEERRVLRRHEVGHHAARRARHHVRDAPVLLPDAPQHRQHLGRGPPHAQRRQFLKLVDRHHDEQPQLLGQPLRHVEQARRHERGELDFLQIEQQLPQVGGQGGEAGRA